MSDAHDDLSNEPDWTDADALLRAGWLQGPDLAARLGISVRTLQRRAAKGSVRRIQIGRETFYATNDIERRQATGRRVTDLPSGRDAGGGDDAVATNVRGDGRRATDRRRATMSATNERQASGAGADGVGALLELVRELRESLVDAERRAAVAVAERDALRVQLDVTPARALAGVIAPTGIEPTPVDSAPMGEGARGSLGDGATLPSVEPSDDAAAAARAEVHRLRGVLQRRTDDLEAERHRVEALESELARAGADLATAVRERDEAKAAAAAARAQRDAAFAERDDVRAALDEVVTERDTLRDAAAGDVGPAPGLAGSIVVAGETIPMTDVESRMKRLVIERNEYRMQAKEFRDQRRRLEQDIKRMRRSRSSRRIDDSGWSKR